MLTDLKMLCRRYIVREVPPELAACEICRDGQCSEQRWLTCPNRISQEAKERAFQLAREQNKPAP